MNKITYLYTALQAGKSLQNPETWKNWQALVNAIGSILILIPQFTEIALSEHDLNMITVWIASTAGLVNMYLTYATSTKVGIPNGKNN